MNRSRYPPLLLPIFWKANTFFPPKVTKAKKKRIKKELENKKKAAKNQKEADTIQANLIAVEDAQAWNAGSCCQYFNHHRVRFPK